MSWKTIVHKLAHALRQPAYLRPICHFYYLKLLPPREETKTTNRYQYCNKNKIKSLFMYPDIVKTSLLSTSIHVLGYITAIYKSKLLML